MTRYDLNSLKGLIKIAKKEDKTYYFFLHHVWRFTSVFMFLALCFFGFVYLFLNDFEVNLGLSLYFVGISILCVALFCLSFSYVCVLSDKKIIILHSLFRRNRQIPTNTIDNILRHTITEYTWSASHVKQTNSRYYLCLNDDKKIQLCCLKHYDIGMNISSFLIKFDALMQELSEDLKREIIIKTEKEEK